MMRLRATRKSTRRCQKCGGFGHSSRSCMKGGAADTTALLVIDFQKDFCPKSDVNPDGGRLGVAGADKILDEVKKLQALAKGWKLRIATQDWHPRDHVSFLSNNKGPFIELPSGLKLATLNHDGHDFIQAMWPNHCIQPDKAEDNEKGGVEFFPGFDTTGYEIIHKGTIREVDSYSGFGDALSPKGQPKKYEDTKLKETLDKNGIKHVVVCGIATDYCVAATCMDAIAYGYQVTLVLKASAGVADETIAKALTEMQAAGVNIVENSTKVTDEENMA